MDEALIIAAIRATSRVLVDDPKRWRPSLSDGAHAAGTAKIQLPKHKTAKMRRKQGSKSRAVSRGLTLWPSKHSTKTGYGTAPAAPLTPSDQSQQSPNTSR
jgi:hypothetical protein